MEYNYYNHNYVQLPMGNPFNYNSVLPTMPNRFVYVNQNFHKPKVLINPNFKKTVHINPNFKGTIHVNPNIMKLQGGVLQKKTDCGNNDDKVVPSKITNSIKPNVKVHDTGSTSNERRQSVHTKYKIVHAKNGQSDIPKEKQGVKSKYKIDKRTNVCNRRPNMKKIIKSRYKLLNAGAVNNKLPFKSKNSSKLININGILYKKTPNVLKKADLTTNKSTIKKKLRVLKINGKIYKLSRSTTSSSKSRCSISRSISKKKLLLSQTRNFNNQVFLSKMRKCNVPCPIYRKFGKCHEKNKGTCFRIHNPDQIALCTRFLQGACRKKNCLLSHKVSAEKMPTCKYYLEGLCTREDCPYLHVKINPKADICKDFLEGFCKKAKECDKRHQFLCPDYEKTGSCPRKRCQYPHGDGVRKYCLKAKVAKKTIKVLRAKIDKIKAKRIQQKEEKGNNDNEKNVRYYIDTTGNHQNLDIFTNNDNEKDDIDDILISDLPVSLKNRKNLGDLPSFIPFGE